MPPYIRKGNIHAKVSVGIIERLKHVQSRKAVTFNALVEEALEDLLIKYKQQSPLWISPRYPI